MKKFATLLFGSLLALLVYAVPGDAVQAAEDEHCVCEFSVVTGAERNKMVSNLLKTEHFKSLRTSLEASGFTWGGAKGIEIIDNHTYQVVIVGVPFVQDGNVLMVGYFVDGDKFMLFPGQFDE